MTMYYKKYIVILTVITKIHNVSLITNILIYKTNSALNSEISEYTQIQKYENVLYTISEIYLTETLHVNLNPRNIIYNIHVQYTYIKII